MALPTPDQFNTGLVAVSDRNGGFHIYMTGGLWDPRKWIAGKLDGSRWFVTKMELEGAAKATGCKLVRHADYYQLQVEV